MTRTIDLIYDGTVLRPVGPVTLEKGKRYKAQLDDTGEEPTTIQNPWNLLRSMEGMIDGPSDWSTQLDHYLYGMPKHGQQ